MTDKDQYLPVLLEIKGQLGVMEGKLDGFLTTQADLKSKVETQDQRLTALERREAHRLGMVAGVSLLVSALVGVLAKFGDKLF